MPEIFPARLRAARELRKLSQSDLADRSGLQPSAVSHFETGRRSPSFENLKALSEALQVTTDFLLGRVDDPMMVGAKADTLFRHAAKMSSADLDRLTDFAKLLARKPSPRKKG
jgi:transcriptional regulator with XRE-family HTH domain